MKKLKEEVFCELPSLQFAKSRMVGDCILEGIAFSVSAETSSKCLRQFKDMVLLLEENERKNVEIKQK